MTSLGYLQYSEINDSSTNSAMTEIDKKKQARHNITIKKRHDTNPNSENVQNMLKLINNSNGYENDGDDANGLADFNPPPRAEVSTKLPEKTNTPASVVNTPVQELNIDYEKPTAITQIKQEEVQVTAVNPRQYPTPLDSYEGFNSLPKNYASNYYKQYTNQPDQYSHMNKNQMLEKLNYMIHLLEEQKDEKTGHVMEEVILYSFLGVFIIFIIDSFARVGKYTR